MILVDTSVWVNHFRTPNGQLVTILDENQVLGHPFVVGEIACGSITNRAEILARLDRLPPAPRVRDSEVRVFLESRQLMRRAIGYIDVHLLASAALAGPALLWTHDRRLARVADELGLAFTPP